jgi:uncharacterized heparinase superfamily protein
MFDERAADATARKARYFARILSGAMPSLHLLRRTLLQYEPRQLVNYALRRTVRPRPDLRSAPSVRQPPAAFAADIPRPFPEIRPDVFRLLQVERTIAKASDWNAKGADQLWLYTLHYMEMLSAGTAHADRQEALIRRWIAENPPAEGIGWEAYPISLRAMQWIKWLAGGGAPPPGMIDSLATQIRHLQRSLEWHLGANHLFANAVALVAAGMFFEGAQADEWRNRGLHILAEELPKQFLADGGHYELSPSYHALLLEMMLDLSNLARTYGFESLPWGHAQARALGWLRAVTRPDGLYPHFNDCTQGVAPTLSELESYARRLDVAVDAGSPLPVTDMAATGYARFEGRGFSLFADAGQFAPRAQPGHGHCDMLSFEFYAGGAPVFVNTGISTYERSARRQAERSTAAHNTIQIGGHEQTEIWSAFRAGRRAKIIERICDRQHLSATHDGFRHFGILHKRNFELLADGVAIEDELLGRRPADPAVARFHLAPGIEPARTANGFVAGPVAVELAGQSAVSFTPYLHAPAFNTLVPAVVVEVTLSERLMTKVRLA